MLVRLALGLSSGMLKQLPRTPRNTANTPAQRVLSASPAGLIHNPLSTSDVHDVTTGRLLDRDLA